MSHQVFEVLAFICMVLNRLGIGDLTKNKVELLFASDGLGEHGPSNIITKWFILCMIQKLKLPEPFGNE